MKDFSEFSTEDLKFMDLAIRLGLKGKGFTEPNPNVGAIVVKDGEIISTGFHSSYGEDHAERAALKKTDITGATLYVSLEPCSHRGQTPPCTDIIIEKKVKRVVIPFTDPNPNVNGKGVKKLRENNIKVDTGILKEEAAYVNRHYLKYITTGLPWVTINAGVTIDGKLTDKHRKSQWITGELLRSVSHSFRGEFSAICAGYRTITDDDPLLTLRETGWNNKKLVRVILDSDNRLKKDLKIFDKVNRFPVFIFSEKGTESNGKRTDNHFFVDKGKDGLKLEKILEKLGELKISSLLVEGGGSLISSFLKKSLGDEIVLFTSDKILGGKDSVELFSDGRPLKDHIVLKNREILDLDEGYIIRGQI
ncbi:MAG: bifunctional diaminohydroxyphosphoribosylaminopyrimidine deaminase/5-amino-6-(5-phosphoribosylamino)uracil reductase RibD [Acidobacteriota bacterium]